MIIKNPRFEVSAVKESQYPQNGLPEVVLVGKSNVGKSSFVNTMINRRKLARTSSEPGKTRQLNFYNMDEDEFYNMLLMYKDRYSNLIKDEKVQYVSIFKNYLRQAGASLNHPHSQIVSISIIPPDIEREINISKQYYIENKRYLYDNIINEEIRNQIEELIKLDEQNKGVYEFKSIEDKQKFYIQDDNIVVYFDLYDIAPYAAGVPEFPITSKNIENQIELEYMTLIK